MELKLKCLREDTTGCFVNWLAQQMGHHDITMERKSFDNPLKGYVSFKCTSTNREVKFQARTYYALAHFMQHQAPSGYFSQMLNYGRPVSEPAEIILKYLTSNMEAKEFKEWVKALVNTED